MNIDLKNTFGRLRSRFVGIFEDLLKTQLLLKNIIVENDWEQISKCIVWIFAEDNNFVKWKEAEVLNSQIESLSAADSLVGKYFDKKWILKQIIHSGDDVVKKMLEDAEKERLKLSQYNKTDNQDNQNDLQNDNQYLNGSENKNNNNNED